MTNNKLNLSGVTSSVWVRTILTIIVAINVVLSYLGMSPLPANSDDITLIVNGIAALVSVFIILRGFWFDNSFTWNAQKVHEAAKQILISAEQPIQPEEIDPDAMGYMGAEGLPGDK